MPSCAIITCRARSQVSSISQGGVSFHRFPKERKLREKWIKITGREHWIPTRTSTICSRHFSEDDFIVKTSGNRFLMIGAVPSQMVVNIHSNTDPAAASSPTIEIKTERLEEPMSPTNSSNGDTDEPLRIGQLATIANDPLRPKFCSPSEAESNASSIDEENKDIDLRKRLKEKEETCKEHMNKIKSLLKANRRLCLQNKNLKRMLMTMKKKISILEGNERASDDEGS